MEKVKVTPANGNVFADLGFSPEEANNLYVRSRLLNEVQRIFRRRKLKQAEAAKLFGVSQPRLSLALKGSIGEFSIDALVSMLSHAGRHVDVSIRPARKAA
jgi:predicted XRE-type DNA-binding protein